MEQIENLLFWMFEEKMITEKEMQESLEKARDIMQKFVIELSEEKNG
jgi:hypothetical protein